MSSIYEDKKATPLSRMIHRAIHEIEERTDTPADKVAEIIDMWEDWKDRHGVKRDG